MYFLFDKGEFGLLLLDMTAKIIHLSNKLVSMNLFGMREEVAGEPV